LNQLHIDRHPSQDRSSAHSPGCAGACSGCATEGGHPQAEENRQAPRQEPSARGALAWACVFLAPLALGALASTLAGSPGAQLLLALAGGAVGVVAARLTIRWLGFRGEAR
jgi:uncharacterized membrane protein (DUF4010 family)